MDPAIGKKIGNYRIQRCIGRGAMGAVYLAQHEQIQCLAAVKVLHARFAGAATLVQRFLGEARVANRIGHPGIVRIYDCGDHPEVGLHLVMEYLQGQTLEQRSQDALPLPVDLATRHTLQIASVLAACHSAGITHRDLKPANLFLVSDPDIPGGERIKVLDFGIAKLHEPTEDMVRTRTGVLVGSPVYMAPEQCLDSRQADHRSDIYSLGVIYYQLLTGQNPLRADSLAQLVLAQQDSRPDPPSQHNPAVGQAIDAVVLCMLQRDPELRFQSVDLLRHALCSAEPSQACAPGPLAEVDTEVGDAGDPAAQTIRELPAAALADAAQEQDTVPMSVPPAHELEASLTEAPAPEHPLPGQQTGDSIPPLFPGDALPAVGPALQPQLSEEVLAGLRPRILPVMGLGGLALAALVLAWCG